MLHKLNRKESRKTPPTSKLSPHAEIRQVRYLFTMPGLESFRNIWVPDGIIVAGDDVTIVECFCHDAESNRSREENYLDKKLKHFRDGTKRYPELRDAKLEFVVPKGYIFPQHILQKFATSNRILYSEMPFDYDTFIGANVHFLFDFRSSSNSPTLRERWPTEQRS